MRDKQELLENLLGKELLELKRMCFKYKHNTPFICNKIVISYDNISETRSASGTWEKVNGKREYDYTHKITVDSDLIDTYLNFKPSYAYRFFNRNKIYYKKLIRQVIRHELIHAFVEERYQFITDINNVHVDASPIFLSVLYWLSGISTHECAEAFKRTELYKKIIEIKTFDELDTFIFNLLIEYRDVNQRLKEYKKIGDTILINSFTFGSRHPGVVNRMQLKTRYLSKDKLEVRSIENNMFEVGCCIMPDQIEQLINKKRYGKFNNYQFEKVAINNENKKVATIYKEVVGF